MSRMVSWAAAAAWMGCIFYLSHQPAGASNQLSLGVTETLANVIQTIFPNAAFPLDSFNFFVRKAAHFFAYFILGVLVFHAFLKSGVHGWRNVRHAMLLCVLYAISDEVHQLFVAGRSGQVRDVFIDSVGAAAGILLYYGVCKMKRLNRR